MVKWVNDQRICAIWTLRSQNVSLISFCDAGPWHCQTVIFFKNSFFKLKEAQRKIDRYRYLPLKVVWKDGLMWVLICFSIPTETPSFTWRQFKQTTRKIISPTSLWLTPSRDIRGLSPNTNQKSITCSDGIRTMGETLCECDRETKHICTFLVSIFIPFHSIGITRLQPKVADRKDKSTGLKSTAKKLIRTPSSV